MPILPLSVGDWNGRSVSGADVDAVAEVTLRSEAVARSATRTNEALTIRNGEPLLHESPTR